ncbi:MAG TPA: LuxR C-terminal-related transcriptional regulator [Thermomicrobiales bacterium]|nr:LuxR C-terminal-related transcriptional regulator [Thermomicrobiales bacterium]
MDRQRELADILRLLATPEARLVSVTGPGGVGKTQLARRAAAIVDRESRGLELVWLSLAPMERSGQVAHAIGEAFELKGSDSVSLAYQLAGVLLERRALLVLDNFEHLQEAAPLIAELLSACPTLTMLITSRGPLHISGESELALEPLGLPAEHGKLEDLAASPAVELFLERASPRFGPIGPSEDQLRAISSICRRLDGLPLAIELAATWSRILSPAQLLDRLDRRLPMLTDGPVDAPARLRTMRAAIDWSYALLSQREQELFRTVCIFVGAFTLEAAERITQIRSDPAPGGSKDDGFILKGLAQLVNHGLVSAPAGGRFAMLQTIREFGLETLAQMGELDDARLAHLTWCTSLVSAPDDDPLDGYIWSDAQLAGEQDELNAALGYAIEIGDAVRALKLASGLSPIWAEQGRYGEARHALGQIALIPALDPRKRAIVVGWESEWAWLQGDYRSTRNLASASLDACQELGIEAGVAANRYRLGRVATLADPAAAGPLLEQALSYYQSTADDRASCWCLIALGHISGANGEWQAAQQRFAQAGETLRRIEDGPGSWLTLSLALAEAQLALDTGDDARANELLPIAIGESRAQRNLYYASLALVLWCRVSLRQGDIAEAAAAGREGLQIAQQLGSLLRQWQCLEQLVSVAIAFGQLERASRLHGAATVLGERIRSIEPITAVERELARADGFDNHRHDALVSLGRQLSQAETMADVLELERDIGLRQGSPGLLSKRELHVLALLAEGMTNSVIADRLFVSSRTVDSHVGSILKKLQAPTRADAVESARVRGLLTSTEG